MVDRRAANILLIMLIFALISPNMMNPWLGQAAVSDSRAELTSTYLATNVLNQPGGSLAGGIAFGDPDNDGVNEVIVVGGSGEAGRVTVVDYNESTKNWDTPTIWVDNQALVDVIAADIDPFSDGEELIVGGYSRKVSVLYWPGGTGAPRNNTIDTLPQQIFGMAAGDFNSSHAGLELAVVDGKSENLTIYQSGSAKHLWERQVFRLNESLRNVEAGDYDPNHDGDELIILSSNGTIFSAVNDNDAWDFEMVWQDSDKLLDAAIGDADNRYAGNEIITVGLSRHATLLRKTDTGDWDITALWTAPGGLEGIDIGEFDPSHEGVEIAIGGYSRTVVMVYQDGDEWFAREIYQDKESSQSELNGVVIGEFYSAHKDTELMVVGASGVTTLIEYVHPDFTLSTPTVTKTVDAGSDAVFTIVIGTVSSFTGSVKLSVASDLDWALSDTAVNAPGTSTLTISTGASAASGEYSLNVTADHLNDTKVLELTVIIESSTKPDFSLNLSNQELQFERLPKAGSFDSNSDLYSDTLTIGIDTLHGFDGRVELDVTGLPLYFDFVTSVDSIYPGEESQINLRLVDNPPEDEDEYSITITGKFGNVTHLEVVKIKLFPSTVKNGNGDTDSAAWVPAARILLIVIVIILVILIILLRSYKYITNQITKENDKKND